MENKVLQTSDVWSLGCVFSVAASFVVLGEQGVVLYKKVRKAALEKYKGNAADSYAFHNGSTVLPEVLEWHKYLRCIHRQSDGVTGKILDVVESKMLQPEGNRATAKEVLACFQEILSNYTHTPGSGEFPEIVKYLQKFDINAELETQQEPTQNDSGKDGGAGICLNGSGGERGFGSSEDLLNMRELHPTSQRNTVRPMSVVYESDGISNIRRVYSGPRSGRAKTHGANIQRLKTMQNRRSVLAAIEIQAETIDGQPALTSDVRNWCEVEDELKRNFKERDLKTIYKGVSEAKTLKQTGRALLRRGEAPVKGKASGDDALAGHFDNRDLVSFAGKETTARTTPNPFTNTSQPLGFPCGQRIFHEETLE